MPDNLHAIVDAAPGMDRVTAKLQRQARIFDKTLSSIADFAYIFDRDGRFIYANKALLDLWGLPLEMAAGKNFFELKYPDDIAAKLQRQIQQVIDTDQPLADETPYTSPTGVVGYYEYIFTPVFDADGKVEVVAGSTRDITARKRTEILLDAQKQSLERMARGASLRETLEYLVEIVEAQSNRAVIASILLLDDEGKLRIGAGKSLPDDYNAAIDGLVARQDLGTCSVAAVTGKVVITPDINTDPKWQCIKHLPLGLGLKAAWSQPIMARDGRVLGTFGTYFRECREPSEFERQTVEILSSTAAIAIERQRADDERERLLASERAARAEADAANREKDKFLAVLSHELRTPLSPVVMALPAMELDPDMPFKFKEDLAMMRRNIDLEVKLIDDLLDLSRVVSGKLALKMECVQVHALLIHAIRPSLSEIGTKRLTILQEFGARRDEVSADPARLEQVFWNLLRNAVKFTPDGGEIIVKTWNDAEGLLCAEVKDTGVGIDPAMLPKVFNAFEQGESRMHGKFGGLGLGLAIAKAVVEMHGATISAASEGPGRGSAFTVRLPVMKPSAHKDKPAGHLPGAEIPTIASARILLVEDHPDTVRMLARLLKLSGFDVKTACSAAAALQLAASEPFDILVSDIGLPDATGYELMSAIRDQFGIKGIALSGYGMEEDLRKSKDAGFADHLVKPVSVAQLRAVIERVAGNGQ
jgi:PAS domain S-box-containing protein